MTLGVGVDHTIATENSHNTLIFDDEDTGKMVFRVQARPGVPIKINKIVTYHTSRGVPSRELIDRCRRTLDRVREQGVEVQYAAQREWLDDYWERSDVEVAGQPALQQAIRWNLYQIAQATARAEQSGVPAKGVTGSGYSGHYFWDTEIYVLPFLTYTNPSMARSALRFRYNMLEAAKRAVQRARRRAAPCSPGAPSAVRRPPRTTPPGLRSTTSTRTSRTRCASTLRRAATKVHESRRHRHPGGDRADVGRPRLLEGQRQTAGRSSTSTG